MRRQAILRQYRWWCVLLCAQLVWLAMPVCALATIGERRFSDEFSDSCAIDAEGLLECGGSFTNQLSGRYLSVASSELAICALRSDGEAVCRSKSGSTLMATPAGPWRSLAVGGSEACGLHSDGRLECWSDVNGGVAAAAPTSGRFIAVSISHLNGCAIRSDGALQCWTRRYQQEYLGAPPAGRFSRVDVSDYHACALSVGGRVICWGKNLYGSTDAPEEGGFVDVSVGRYHGCALREHGSVVCWGSSWSDTGFGNIKSPSGEFTDIESASDSVCGRKPEGTVQCWGRWSPDWWPYPGGAALTALAVGGGEACVLDADGETHCTDRVPSMRPTPGRYSQLSLGSTSGCGVGQDGGTTCWGESLGPTPAAAMSTVSVGKAHACGVLRDGAIVCWGDNSFGQAEAPSGIYLSVVASDRYSCALTTGETVVCWGQGPAVSDVPLGNGFRKLLASNGVVCANREFGPAQCWGDGGTWLKRVKDVWSPMVALGDYFFCWQWNRNVFCDGDTSRDVPGFREGDFIAVAAAGDRACTIDSAEELVCRGAEQFERRFNMLRIGTGTVAAGAAHTCSTDSGGLIHCWGDNTLGQRDAPRVRARAIDVSADHACAVVGSSMLQCWGDGSRGGSLPPPGVAARSIGLGQYNGCAVRSDGSASCWGWNVNGQSLPPADTFRRVATGLNHSCGLRDDNTLVCWGYGADGQTAAPAGEFMALDVGERHSCAIAADGELRCWGLGSEGQTMPLDPAGTTYRVLSSGSFHNCAIRSDGTLACWGRNEQGQSTPPQGRFVSVSAGVAHSCAIRDDGARVCWGSNSSGQSPTLVIGPENLPRGDLDVPYEATLLATASVGYAPLSPKFRLVSGALPAGMKLVESGLVHGMPKALGAFDVVVEVRDANGFSAQRPYRVQIGPPRNTTPPLLEFAATGPLGDDGWYVGDVDIRWSYESQESGIDHVSGCESYVQTHDTAYLHLECTVGTRGGGARRESRTLKRDATPPQIRAWLDPEVPSAEGWYRASVTVAYDCWDETSGVIGDCPQNAVAMGEGVHTFPIQSVRDRAGNIATTSADPIRIDMTRPQLYATMPPAQLPVGASHDFQATATDVLSGVRSVGCTPIDTSTPSTSGPGPGTRVATCTAIDRAGNSTSLSSVYEVVPKVGRASGSKSPIHRAPRSIQRGAKSAKPRIR